MALSNTRSGKIGTVAQGFIGLNRRNQYEKELKCGMIYTLTNYYASNTKVMYHVADQRLVICISHASELRKVEEDIEAILTERFRIHSFADFEANCDLRGDLHGKLCLSSMSSSRVFLDEEVDPTKEYLTCDQSGATPSSRSDLPIRATLPERQGRVARVLITRRCENESGATSRSDTARSLPKHGATTWSDERRSLAFSSLGNARTSPERPLAATQRGRSRSMERLPEAWSDYSERRAENPGATSSVNPVEVVKAETLTISEIAAFIKREPAKKNGGDGAELEVPLPQCFIDAIGHTKKFRIKVSPYNFTSTRLSLTATKIVSSAVLPSKNPPPPPPTQHTSRN
ncbi:hypothetical protein YC2023_062555 [Brassica napus]